MKTLILCLCVSVTAFAADANLIRQSVVKIVSKLQGVSAEFRGSGLVFEREGKRYVLTSDHVVAHTNGSLGEHVATSSVTGEKLKLKFLASEWGNGLALLEVQKDSGREFAVPYADLLLGSAAKAGDNAAFFGYPFETTDLTEETFARVLNLAAPAPYFVFARTLVELEAAVGEFGMSGGPAFSTENQFMGVLAYQRILEQTRDNRVYLVSRDVVIPWLEHYFAVKDQFKPQFSEPWFGQGDPRQLLLTNDGLLLMFRAFEGKFRLGVGRMEHLMVLSDGPSLPYDDKRGFMKIFRTFMKENPQRPSEFGVIDRSSGKPVLKAVHFPAEVFASFDEPGTSLLLILGETHEDRYGRVSPLVERLKVAFTALDEKMKGALTPQWREVSDDFSKVIAKLSTIPAKPSDPTVAGAVEFFSADWVTGLFFQIEANATLSGWTEAMVAAPGEAAQTKQTLKALVEAFRATEVRPE